MGHSSGPSALSPYEDHVGLWQNKLREWLPERVFDAHMHLGPADAIGPTTDARRLEAVTTFASLEWGDAEAFLSQLYTGKQLAGVIAFGFPLREADLERVNGYIAEVAQRDPRVHGFIVSDPHDTARTIRQFEAAEQRGRGFCGIKPYYDLLGKPMPNSCFHSQCEEFVPDDLLRFANDKKLPIMLHTGDIGVGSPSVQDFLRRVVDRFPRVPIVLAHMGRYVQAEQFLAFMETDLPGHPNLWFEMSSASSPAVYEVFLSEPARWDRLIFGADLPYGLITGQEHWSETHGAVFLTRDDYPWSDPEMNRNFADERGKMTYNAYHTLAALVEAVRSLGVDGAELDRLKRGVFHDNAARLLGISR